MNNHLLKGKNVLITAGPTREPLDPLHYISNNGGKTGYSIASLMLQQGARVFLVSGPVKVEIKHPMLSVVKVNTACEMYMACCKYFEAADIIIFAAAVSDYRPKEIAPTKISSNENSFTVKMIKNIDIAAAFAKCKKSNQLTVGIATEINDNVHQAISKMERKNLDMIVLNTIQTNDMERTENKNVSILKSDYSIEQLRIKSKPGIIKEVVSVIEKMYYQKQSTSPYQLYTAVPSHRSLMA